MRISRYEELAWADLHSPLVAFGAYSACMTGTVELTIPRPVPATTRATIRCARVKAVACRMAPMSITTTPIAMLLFRPSCSPTMAVKILPKNAPISMMETIRAIMVDPGELNVSLKAFWLTRPPIRPLSNLKDIVSSIHHSSATFLATLSA